MLSASRDECSVISKEKLQLNRNIQGKKFFDVLQNVTDCHFFLGSMLSFDLGSWNAVI